MMNNFVFENKTKVYFGKNVVKEHLGGLLSNYGETVMLAYGGGSVKRNGLYDEVMGILNAAGKRVVEFDRIMPNPTYAKVQEPEQPCLVIHNTLSCHTMHPSDFRTLVATVHLHGRLIFGVIQVMAMRNSSQ